MPPEEEFEAPSLPITYRPPALLIIGWFIACCVIGVAFYFGFHVALEAPMWVQYLVGFQVTAALSAGILQARVFITFTEEGVITRSLSQHRYNWDDLESWSQQGSAGNTFLQTSDGKVVGIDRWCLTGSKNQEVYAILESHLGPETKGEDAVRPAFLKFIIENMIPQDDSTS